MIGWGWLAATLTLGILVGALGAVVARGRARRREELDALVGRAEVARLRAESAALTDAARRGERAEALLEAARDRVAALERDQGLWLEGARRLAALEARWAAAGDDEARAAALTLELEAARLALARAEAALENERLRSMERERDEARARELAHREIHDAAQTLVQQQGQTMLEDNEKALRGLLDPMRERLAQLETQLGHQSEREGRDRAALLERLSWLAEAQSRLHADAQALTRALTSDHRAQGDWGELVLENLLEAAGLTEGREYELQVEHRDDDGLRRRPDVLVHLPQGRVVVIDAKCSLQAFVASTRATDDEERERDLLAHVAAVRAHVRLLSEKGYQRAAGGESLDVVFLFLPNEAALHAAISRDPTLFEDAFRQQVVVCGPSTLLATLQVVSHVWRSERQTLNAQRIADEAGKMIDKLAGALEAFDELGDRLTRAQTAFDQARSRLSTGRNSVSQIASRVVDLGAPQHRTRRLETVQQSLGFSTDAAATEKDGDW